MSGENMTDFSDSFVIIVKPNSKKTEFIGESNGKYRVNIKEKAMDGKANLALVKFFKKELGINVRIKSGLKNREKVLEKV